MTLDRARELIAIHAEPGSGCSRIAAGMLRDKVMRDQVQAAVDRLIRDYGVAQRRGITPRTHCQSAFE